MTMRLSVCSVLVNDQDDALRFYVDRLGFVVAEDSRMGDYRWLLVRMPETADVAINLHLAETAEERALVGKQSGGGPLFALATDDCRRDFETLKARGVAFEGEPHTEPYGIGVTLRDLYGNRFYLNQELD